MWGRSWVIGLGSVVVSCFPTTPPAGPATVPQTKVTQYDDASGIRVVIEQSPDFGTAAVVLSVSAGSGEDPPDQAGLAHLVEHLVMSATHDGTSLWDRMAELGGVGINGTTGWDGTTYFAGVPTASVEPLIRVMAEVLRDPLAGVDQATFDHELSVVRNELHLRDENGASGEALRYVLSAAFPRTHPYSHGVGGTLGSLSQVTLEDAGGFARKWYRPEHSTLIISTPTPQDDVARRTVASAFEQLPRASRSHRAPADPLPKVRRIPFQRSQAPVATATLWIGWPVTGELLKDSAALRLLPDLLEYAFFRNPGRFDRSVSRIEPALFEGRRASMLYLKAPLNSEEQALSTARDLVRQLINASAQVTSSLDDFYYVKRSAEVQETYVDEDILARSLRIAHSSEQTNDPTFLRDRSRQLASVTSAKMIDLLQSVLSEDRMSVALLTPSPVERDDSASAKPRREANLSLDTRLREPHGDLASAAQWVHPIHPARLLRRKLSNGLEVWFLRQPGSTFHTALLGFHGGSSLGDTLGIDQAMPWAQYARTAPASNSGLLMNFSVAADYTWMQMRGIGSNLRSSLEALHNKIDFSLYWPPRQFTSQLSVFEQEEGHPEVQLHRAARRTLFGDHVYGRSARVEDLRGLSATNLHDWLKQVRQARNGILIWVGEANPNYLLGEIESQFGDFGTESAERVEKAAPPPPVKLVESERPRVLFRQLPDSTLAKVTISCLLPRVDDRSFSSARVLGHLLHTTLLKTLRKQDPISYSIAPSLEVLRDGTSVLTLRADLEYGGLEEAMDHLRKVYAPTAPSMVDDRNLTRAKVDTVRLVNWRESSTHELAQELLFAWAHGWPAETVLQATQRALAVEAPAVADFERNCRRTAVLAFLGNEDRLRAAWGE